MAHLSGSRGKGARRGPWRDGGARKKRFPTLHKRAVHAAQTLANIPQPAATLDYFGDHYKNPDERVYVFDQLIHKAGVPYTKVPHLRGFAVLVLLAVVAFGTQRLLEAFVATMALAISCELAQATVVGHHARLADLAPNLLGGAIPLVVVAGLRRVCSSGDNPA